jgi:hypothetical protein
VRFVARDKRNPAEDIQGLFNKVRKLKEFVLVLDPSGSRFNTSYRYDHLHFIY